MIDALHARHIPVGDLQVEIAVLKHGQGRRAVVGLRGVVESEITQQILDDAAHGRKIVDHLNLHVSIQDNLPWRWRCIRYPVYASRRMVSALSSQRPNRACKRMSAWLWIWLTRDSLTPMTAPISRKLSSTTKKKVITRRSLSG